MDEKKADPVKNQLLVFAGLAERDRNSVYAWQMRLLRRPGTPNP